MAGVSCRPTEPLPLLHPAADAPPFCSINFSQARPITNGLSSTRFPALFALIIFRYRCCIADSR
jgi:hypothetical protein